MHSPPLLLSLCEACETIRFSSRRYFPTPSPYPTAANVRYFWLILTFRVSLRFFILVSFVASVSRGRGGRIVVWRGVLGLREPAVSFTVFRAFHGSVVYVEENLLICSAVDCLGINTARGRWNFLFEQREEIAVDYSRIERSDCLHVSLFGIPSLRIDRLYEYCETKRSTQCLWNSNYRRLMGNRSLPMRIATRYSLSFSLSLVPPSKLCLYTRRRHFISLNSSTAFDSLECLRPWELATPRYCHARWKKGWSNCSLVRGIISNHYQQ